MIPNTRQNLVSHLIYLTLAYASAQCSPFIHLLGTRLTPDAVSQSLIQSVLVCHFFSVGHTLDQYLHVLGKSEFSARSELIATEPKVKRRRR